MEKELNIQEIVRQELLQKAISTSCERAFLSAIIRGAGEIGLSQQGYSLKVTSESKELVDTCIEIIKKRYNFDGVVTQLSKNIGMRTLQGFRVFYDTAVAKELLQDTFIIKGYEFVEGIEESLISSSNQARVFLRGIFLSCGYLSTPTDRKATEYNGKKGYHLEFRLNSYMIKDDLKRMIAKLCRFKEKSIKSRKDASAIYMKSAQNISDLLAAMGASRGVLELQQVMTNRAMRNHLNRGNNFILANIDRSISATEKQILAIQKIEKIKGWGSIGEKLKETAMLRLQYPNATLNELANKTDSSRSKIYHRLRKIQEIANDIKEN